MKTRKKINPQAFLEQRGKQTCQYATLDKMLCENGFVEAGRTGGDHTHYKHEGSGITVGIILGENKIVYQKTAAQACLDVIEWKKVQDQERKNKLTEEFETTAKTQEPGAEPAKNILPADKYSILTLEGHDDVNIIRLKDRPQIGIILASLITNAQAETVTRELDSQKLELEELLTEMHEEMEYTVTYVEGGKTIKIGRPIYGEDSTLDLPEYSPLEDHAITRLKVEKEEVQSIDEEAQDWVKQHTDLATKPPKQRDDGKMEWSIPLKHFISLEETELTLVTTPKNRLPVQDIYAFIQKMLEFERGGPADTRRLKATLAQSFGANLTVKKSGQDRNLLASHPFEKEPLFEIQQVYTTPSISEIFRKYMETEDDEENIEFADKIFEIITEWDEDKNMIIESLNAFVQRMETAKEKYQDLVKQAPSITMAPGKQAPQKGNIGFNVINHPDFDSPVRLQYLSRGVLEDPNSPTGQGIAIYPNPQDVDTLEQKMITAGLISKQNSIWKLPAPDL